MSDNPLLKVPLKKLQICLNIHKIADEKSKPKHYALDFQQVKTLFIV